MRCQRCFFENSDGAEFCSRCGDVIKKGSSQAKFSIRYRKAIMIATIAVVGAAGVFGALYFFQMQ